MDCSGKIQLLRAVWQKKRVPLGHTRLHQQLEGTPGNWTQLAHWCSIYAQKHLSIANWLACKKDKRDLHENSNNPVISLNIAALIARQ